MIDRVIQLGTVIKRYTQADLTWVLYRYRNELYKAAFRGNVMVKYIYYPIDGQYEVVVLENG